MGPAGAKAKWVRVELKKIETLPGGGQANSYFDHVGPSPIPLWQSSEDYSVLQSVRHRVSFQSMSVADDGGGGGVDSKISLS